MAMATVKQVAISSMACAFCSLIACVSALAASSLMRINSCTSAVSRSATGFNCTVRASAAS